MIKEILELFKTHWLHLIVIILVSFVVLRLFECIFRRIIKRFTKALVNTSKTVIRPLKAVKRLSMIDWILLIIILFLVATIIILI